MLPRPAYLAHSMTSKALNSTFVAVCARESRLIDLMPAASLADSVSQARV